MGFTLIGLVPAFNGILWSSARVGGSWLGSRNSETNSANKCCMVGGVVLTDSSGVIYKQMA